jgi:hypothetical protein
MKLLVVLALLAPAPAFARDPSAVAHFRKENPCPATGNPRGACPGWVVDHIIPLALFGPDRPDNMQWQTVEEAKRKDRIEMEAYRARKKFERDFVKCEPGFPPARE